MRRSEWRRRPNDPKGLLGWWWRDFSAAGWPLYLLMGFAVGTGMVFGSVLASGVALVALVVANALRIALRPDPLHPLLPDPAPHGQFRAAVVYRRGGVTNGWDEMALTVVDGWLIGEGVWSSFALRNEDVALRRHRHRRADSVLTLADGTRMEIVVRGPKTHRALVNWRIGGDHPAGEPIFPPARAHPRETARAKAWMLSGLGFALTVRGAAALLHVWPIDELCVVPMQIGLGTALLACWRWRKLIDNDHAAERLTPLPDPAPAFVEAKPEKASTRA